MPPSFFRDRFFTELSYYQADKPYLSAEKCAERCRMLSLLLTAAINGGHLARRKD